MSSVISVLNNRIVEVDTSTPAVAAKRKPSQVGCQFCPLDKADDIVKLKGFKRITGKSVMVWLPAPGRYENEEHRIAVGPSAQWMWEQFKRVGITRDDCDIQYAVRCWPKVLDEESGRILDRAPTKDEVKCCQLYTQQAIARNDRKAIVHIVLGQVTASAVLGREYKKDTPIFWSEKLQAHIVCLDAPGFFLKGAPQHRVITFQQRLAAAAKFLTAPGKYTYIEEQDYRLVKTPAKVKQVLRIARKYAARGHRISIDIEDGWVNPNTGLPCEAGTGKHVVLCVGITWKPGHARTIVIDHPQAKLTRRNRRKIIEALKAFLESPSIAKVMHHGSSDGRSLKGLLGIRIRGFSFDTNYSAYLKWPNQKKYGLDALSQIRFTEFANYKDIIKQYLEPKVNFATIPLKVMRLYNGADADITKRCEQLTANVNLPLLKAYTDAAFTLDAMERRGPWFDEKFYEEVVHLIPKRLKQVRKKLRRLAGDKKVKLGSPKVVGAIIYDKYKFKPPVDKKGVPKRSTDKDTLKLFANQKKGKGSLFCALLIEFRALSKMETTYIENYKRSAAVNGGQLRTRWWLTGAATGRMSSGGGKSNEGDRINFQNLHGDPVLQNLLISDPNWRIVTADGWLDDWDVIREMQAFLALDYGQVEIRVLAQFCQDPLLIKAVMSGDIHSNVGHELTGISAAEIRTNKKIRTMIKQMHFGLVYGLSPKSLYLKMRSENIDVSEAECEELYRKYFRRFKRVKQWIEDMRQFAERHGYVETLFGFRRPIFTEGEEGRDAYWGNQAVNSPIQGSAHQLLLFALAQLHNQQSKYDRLKRCVMEVHDALVFFNRVRELPEALKQALSLMQDAVPRYIEKNFGWRLSVPLVAEGKIGFRLGCMSDYQGGSVKKAIKSWREHNYWVDRQTHLVWSEGHTVDHAKGVIKAEQDALKKAA